MTKNLDTMQHMSASASHTLALAAELLSDLERDAAGFAVLNGGHWVVVADGHGRASIGIMHNRAMVAVAIEIDGGGRVYRYELPMDI